MNARTVNGKKLVLSFIAHPLIIAPRPTNSAIVLGQNGFKVILVGYRNENQKKIESLGKNAKILRVSLSSRNIKLTFLRQLLSVFEFLYVALILIKRCSPQFVILFNEIANILLRFIKINTVKITWLLEYPEKYTYSIGESLMQWLSIKAWKKADVFVFPTKNRKAMAAVLVPEIINKPSFVVHNSPLPSNIPTPSVYSSNSQMAISKLKEWKENGKIVFIYSGSVGNRYGWDVLIKTIGNIEEPYRLLILGKKHQLGEVEFSNAMIGVRYPNHVEWIDSVPYFELNKIIAMGDFGFVYYIGDNLNTYFSSPGKLYEYLKAGLAILTDSEACIADDIRHYNAGILFCKPITTVKLSEILEQCTQESINEMKKNAQRLYGNSYHFNEQMSGLVKWMQSIQ